MSLLEQLKDLQNLGDRFEVPTFFTRVRNFLRRHRDQVSCQSKYFVESSRITVRECVKYLQNQHGCGRLRNQHPELEYVRFLEFSPELRDLCDRYDLDLSIGVSSALDLNGQRQLIVSCRGTKFFSARNWDLNFSLDSDLQSTLNKRFEIQNRLGWLPNALAYGVSLILTAPSLVIKISKHFLYYRVIVLFGTIILSLLAIFIYGICTGKFTSPESTYPEWINYAIVFVSVFVVGSDIFYPRHRAHDHHIGYDEAAKLVARQLESTIQKNGDNFSVVYLLGHSLAGALMVRIKARLNFVNVRGLVFNCAPSTRGRELHPLILSYRTSSDPLTFFSSKSQSMDTNTLNRKSVKSFALALLAFLFAGYMFAFLGPMTLARLSGALALGFVLSYFFWSILAICRYFLGHFLFYILKTLK